MERYATDLTLSFGFCNYFPLWLFFNFLISCLALPRLLASPRPLAEEWQQVLDWEIFWDWPFIPLDNMWIGGHLLWPLLIMSQFGTVLNIGENSILTRISVTQKNCLTGQMSFGVSYTIYWSPHSQTTDNKQNLKQTDDAIYNV